MPRSRKFLFSRSRCTTRLNIINEASKIGRCSLNRSLVCLLALFLSVRLNGARNLRISLDLFQGREPAGLLFDSYYSFYTQLFSITLTIINVRHVVVVTFVFPPEGSVVLYISECLDEHRKLVLYAIFNRECALIAERNMSCLFVSCQREKRPERIQSGKCRVIECRVY